ncbi:IS66 family transposase [Aliikangiella sp. IMCC44359]|uniref:IS66 family transposase n=1 Tax=Aliikangiella sp. IMCC44359 TaxID=3459125 RepID=UPI00403A85F4
MKHSPDIFPDDMAALKALLLTEREKNKQLMAQNQYLLEQFRLAQHKRFGQSSEAHEEQLDLFNEAEQIADEGIEPEKESISYTRNKPKRKPLPQDLPREVIIHDIADEEKVCDCCGGELHRMGEDKSEQLEFIPASIKVIEHVRPKYSCRTCEKKETQVSIKQAAVPVSPIPKSMATPSLLSQVITSKYQYSLPLYRQEQLFVQHGVELNRKTLSEWMLKCAELFKPIIERWHELMLQQPVIQADETTLNVISEDKVKCYMWLYCTGSDSPQDNGIPNMVLFDYQASRRGQCAVDFLQDFKGYLQADGYAGYEQTQAKLVGCWAHARRKFIEAEKVQGKNKTGKANWAISHIKKLYRIETQIKALSSDEKLNQRQEKALPLLNQFKTWLDKSALQVPPKSAIGKAIAYSLNQWPKLIRYTEDGQLNIDNNRAERAIKPLVIGRKNWLFANTARGAQASATLYSLIETAKANGLIPFDYLNYLLTELPRATTNIEALMPWNFNNR